MKRALSLFLVFILVVGCFPSTVFAGELTTGSHYGSGSRIVRINFGTGSSGSGSVLPDGLQYSTGWYGRGDRAIRIKAFPIVSGNRQEYFTYTTSPNIVDQLADSEVVVAKDYATSAGWHYFGNLTDYNPKGTAWFQTESRPLVQVFNGSHAEMATMYRRGSSEWAKFVNLCDPKANPSNVDVCNASDLERLLTTEISDEAALQARRKNLGVYLGLSEAEAENPYYIVIEQLLYFDFALIENGRVYWETDGKPPKYTFELMDLTFHGMETLMCISRSTYKGLDPGYQSTNFPTFLYDSNDHSFGLKLKAAGGSVINGKEYAARLESTSEKYKWMQGEVAPFPDFEMGIRTNGYSLFSFDTLKPSGAGGNVAVEYQGDVNTSIPAEFVSTGTLNSVSDVDGSGGLGYFDFVNNKFVQADDDETLLQFINKIDTSDEYALCFTGRTRYTISGEDIKLTQSHKSAFEDRPGEGYTDSSLTWGQKSVMQLGRGYSTGAGFVHKVMFLEGYATTEAVERRFLQAFNGAKDSMSGDLVFDLRESTTDKYVDEPVMQGSADNAAEGRQWSTPEVLVKNSDNTYSLSKGADNDQTFGMGYEFIIRGTPITSRKITIKVDVSSAADGSLENISVSSGETWKDDYTTVNSTSTVVSSDGDYTLVRWVVVPDFDPSIEPDIVDGLNAMTVGTPDEIIQVVNSIVTSPELAGGSDTDIGLGSTLDEPPVGYTVYEILRRGNIVQMKLPGEVVLPAYMLNRYFNNVIQTSSALAGHPQKYTLARNWTWVSFYGDVSCRFGGLLGWSSYKDDWVIEYADFANTQEFANDNQMLDRYYPRGTGTWSHSVRSDLTQAWKYSMDTRNMPERAYVIDYAFNLVRGNTAFGDKRSVSGISYQSYGSGTGDNVNLLMIQGQFGVVPKVVKNASPSRNSLAVLETYQEEFNIQSRFQWTGTQEGQHLKPKFTHSRHCRGTKPRRCCGPLYYWNNNSLFTVPVLGFEELNGARLNNIEYTFNNSAFKYTTKNDLGTGGNDFLAGASSKPLSAGKRNSTAGSITDSNFYRFTTVRDTSVDLKYHPENYMVYKIGGTDFASIDAQRYSTVYVMSEVKRTAASSGMYFFRLNANITSVPGTVYSDSMQGGSGMLGLGNSVSIPAGADVTVAADPTGVAIDLYGYTLDLVQVDDDGKLGAVGANKAYKTIVKSGLNAYNEWGNSTSHADLLRHFNSWCDDMLKVENYAADFKLYVNNGLKSENFSATIGHVERGSAGTEEAGIYQLVVEKGILQTGKGDYAELIKQIAIDYGCTQAEARSMFQESAMYTAIINAMETCKNPKNNSKDVISGCPDGLGDILPEWTDQLGGDGNWYDETSRTFVVRRFTNLGNKLCDVIATDKIDYQLAPTGNTQSSENINAGMKYDARWELNIFFDQDRASNVNDLLLGSSTYYDPQNGSGNFNPANNKYSVLFNSIPVDNADFVIPASSTQDFYN